jgi:hypothetical protein
MDLTIQIPDELARHFAAEHGDLSRRVLEMLALEEFKSGHITKPELRRLLGFETRAGLDSARRISGARKSFSTRY